ncbi:MAG TPA: ABC-F family ATP-binding cassette domain-containing protein [Actinomycetota bacterium]
MISISGLTKTFGARTLFRDAELRVGARDRVAIVGPNGSGKTTLFEMIAGNADIDAGRIDMTRSAVLGYLKQETDALRGRTILQEVLSAGGAMSEAGHRLEVLTNEIAESDGAERDALLAEYATLQHRFETLGGYTLEVDAKRILAGLGFRDSDHERMTDEMSGGWLMRVALAKLLLANPDVLLLDEPTNHLDVESVAWLEQFLSSYEGCVLLISHDRDFMNAFATKIVEIDMAKLWTYTGDYAAFVEQRQQRIEQIQKAAALQHKRVEKLEVFINRFRYKKSKAKQVQAKIRFVERMEKIEAPPTEKRRRMGLAFPTPPRAGRVVAELRDVDFAYGDTVVYQGLNAAIERGEKVALVGPNGAGKTTMLKLFAGALTPKGGERALGHNVSVGYFAQHQIEALNPKNRVVEELGGAVPPGVQIEARKLLGRFLFSGDDIDKPVSVLSGGERSRLAMAKLLVEPHNFLCLDEPTNHLDIASRDVLEDALEDYEGSIVLITHDRHLIRSIATRVIEVTPGRVRSHPGDYESYLWKREKEEAEAAAAAERAATAAQPKRSASADKERRRLEAQQRSAQRRVRDRIATIEREIETRTAELKDLEARLADPAFYTAGDGVPDTIRAYEAAKKRVQELESEWDRATEEAGS